jgi:hypothetical protein
VRGTRSSTDLSMASPAARAAVAQAAGARRSGGNSTPQKPSAAPPVMLSSPFSPSKRGAQNQRPQAQNVEEYTHGSPREAPISPFLQGVTLPSRGNNAEADERPYQQQGGEDGFGDGTESAEGTPMTTGRLSVSHEVNLRKRSVTVAVVEHPEGTSTLAVTKDDMRRRGTHAGTMSASSSMHNLSAIHSLVLESHETPQPFTPQQGPVGAALLVAAASALPQGTQQSPSEGAAARSPKNVSPRWLQEPSLQRQVSDKSATQPALPAVLEEAEAVFTAPVHDVPVQERYGDAVEEQLVKEPVSESAVAPVAVGTQAEATAPEEDRADRASPFALQAPVKGSGDPVELPLQTAEPSPRVVSPQPILKQASFGSDLGMSRAPSQIMRAISESRTKTLSFDPLNDNDGGSSSSSAHGGSTPVTPFDRPRIGSYEILYQESPEERMSRPAVVYQATPSPHVSRKRAQSTPLNLLSGPYKVLESAAPSASSGTNSVPFSPALHLSTSVDALSTHPFFHSNGSSSQSLQNLAAESRLHSAPGYPERKTYRGSKEQHRPSSQSSSRRRPKHTSPTRNFSARRQAEDDGEPHFMETFGMLDTLSKPFTRGESMAESQVLHIALRSMKVEGATLLQLAARKISVWWKLVAPRKKLLRRMTRRDECRDIVLAMADSAVATGLMRQRRRRSLLRTGAAMKIQRLFRQWVSTTLVEARRLEREERAVVAWRKLSLITSAVQAAVRIYRYVRYWQRKRRNKRVNKLSAGILLQRTIEKYMQLRTLRKKLEQQQQLYTKMKVASMMSTSLSRNNLYRERELAVACIQKCYRAFLLHKRDLERQYFNIMCSKITYFFIRCIARRRVARNKVLKKAATKIQTFYRGIHTRASILKVVRSGLLLNALWRKHKAYVSLKSQLRRVDRPHTLVIHGIRNIAKKTINSNQMRFKISVWWHPLLHIVSQNDFNTIVQTKQPQFIYNSDNFYLVDTGEPRTARRMSISQSLRKLSSMIVPTARRQSTLSSVARQQSQSRAVSGVFRYSQVLKDSSSTASSSARASILSVYNAVSARASRAGTLLLPPIAGARSAASSLSGPPSASRSSVLIPQGAHAGSSGSLVKVGAGGSTVGAGVGMSTGTTRKESVEVLRPSALLAQQLDIIHSDDESDSDSNNDEDDEEGGLADAEKSPVPQSNSNNSSAGQVKVAGRGAVSRSFLQNRMGLPSPGSGRSQPSPFSSDLSGSTPSPVPPTLATLSGKGAPVLEAIPHSNSVSSSECNTPPPEAATSEPEEGGSSKRWNRLSNVVLNDPNMFLDTDAARVATAGGASNAGSSNSSVDGSSPSKSQVANAFLRSSLNFMAIGAHAQRTKASMATSPAAAAEPKMICHFEDVVVKIPGCHGNSVVKFEIFEGE